MELAIETKALTKRYGQVSGIESLTLQVPRGTVFGFLGPNGAGKTTTIRLLLGLLRPTSGQATILGADATRSPRERLRQVGYLPGEIGLYPDLTGDACLAHLLKLRGGARESQQRMGELRERFQIDFTRRTRECSKGMRQIIGIIQAFLHRPALVILDEPTSGLDPLMQERFYELIAEERARGTTVFLSSHILREVERVCDYAALIRRGMLLESARMEEYRASMARHVRVGGITPEAEARTRLAELQGVTELHAHGGALSFRYQGGMGDLMRLLGQFELDDFTCEAPSLDDVFFRHYTE